MEAPGLGFTNVHFIGIGGAGMSGIALVLHDRGYRVSGSDLKNSRYVRELTRAGIPVAIGHAAETIEKVNPDVVVISTAIPEDNPELKAARARGIAVWPRAKMLAALSEGQRSVCVAGTHGKTTTSSMIAVMLEGLGLDPSFLIGGVVEGYGTNGKNGSGELFVAEADESDESFLLLHPQVAVVTNIEADHLDHYHSMDEIHEAFRQFMALPGAKGTAIVWGENADLAKLAARSGTPSKTYGRGVEFDYVATLDEDPKVVHVETPSGQGVSVRIDANPGVHNLLNATAAIAVADVLGLDVEAAARALSAFKGVKRRFTRVGEARGITIVDDYGHHPTEIKATLAAAKSLGYERVVVLFQPHRYSRTQALAREFASAFDDADELVVMDVFAASEVPIPGVSGKTVAASVAAHRPGMPVSYQPDRRRLADVLVEKLHPGDLFITMGAGDVTMVGPELLERLEEREEA